MISKCAILYSDALFLGRTKKFLIHRQWQRVLENQHIFQFVPRDSTIFHSVSFRSRMEKIWRQGAWPYDLMSATTHGFSLTSLRYQFNLLSESKAVFETVYVHWTPENALKTSREESESVRSKSPLYLGSSHQAHKASERSGARERDRQTDRQESACYGE